MDSYANLRADWDDLKRTGGYRAVRGDGILLPDSRNRLLQRLALLEQRNAYLGGYDPALPDRNWADAFAWLRAEIDRTPVAEDTDVPWDADPPPDDAHPALHRAAHDTYAAMEADWARLEDSPAYRRMWGGIGVSWDDGEYLEHAREEFTLRFEHLAHRGEDPGGVDWLRRFRDYERGLKAVWLAGPDTPDTSADTLETLRGLIGRWGPVLGADALDK